MKTLSKYISVLESRENNLEKFKAELEKQVKSLFNSIEAWETGRMISMLDKNEFKAKLDKDIKELCEKHNVFIANTDEDDAPSGYIRVMFESTYGEQVRQDFDICFHLTDEIDGSDKVDAIMKDGLKPMKAFRKFKMKNYHPERIYLLSNKIDKQKLKQYATQLLADGIIIIYLEKMRKDNIKIELFKDPQSAERVSMYTDDPIPAKYLTYMKLKDFYKSDIYKTLR